jgi:hypothetical protein
MTDNKAEMSIIQVKEVNIYAEVLIVLLRVNRDHWPEWRWVLPT